MGETPIQYGQIWVVDWFGNEVRVRLISRHSDMPEMWNCEEMVPPECGSPGRIFLVHQSHLLRKEGKAEKRD